MQARMSLSQCNQTLLYVVIGTFVFFFIILPMINNCSYTENLTDIIEDRIKEYPGKNVPFMTNTKGAIPVRMDLNKCSKLCCKHTQWLPDNMKTNNTNTDKFIGTNFSCNNGDGSGCVCTTQDDFNIIANRGSTSDICASL